MEPESWLEAEIWEDPGLLHLSAIWDRQVVIDQQGVRSRTGRIDLMALKPIQKDGGVAVTVLVIELKRDVIECGAVGQLARYMEQVRAKIAAHPAARAIDPNRIAVQGVLVGTDIKDDAACLVRCLGYEYWQRHRDGRYARYDLAMPSSQQSAPDPHLTQVVADLAGNISAILHHIDQYARHPEPLDPAYFVRTANGYRERHKRAKTGTC